LGNGVRSSFGARGEQGEVLRGACREIPAQNKNPHAAQNRTGTIHKALGNRWPLPCSLWIVAGTDYRAAADPYKGRWLKYAVFPFIFSLWGMGSMKQDTQNF